PTALAADGQHVKAQTSHFSVFLTGVTYDDSGMPAVNPSLDLAEPPDLAQLSVVDMAMDAPPDLTTTPPPDLTTPPPQDLSVHSADASASSDMGAPPDLGPAPDFGKDGSAS